jgi:glycosyltransferase involved in cell wall biosynthesis
MEYLENPKDFAEKIRFYLKNPELIKQQGESGYHYARINFDREKLALDYINLLEAAI